jgi:hypothetical protein
MLTSLELEYQREFKIIDGDIKSAVDKADTYGITLMDFRFVRRYFLLVVPEAAICFPTDSEDASLSKFLEYYNTTNGDA